MDYFLEIIIGLLDKYSKYLRSRFTLLVFRTIILLLILFFSYLQLMEWVAEPFGLQHD